MTIQANFPAISPTLLLDFANTEALDPRITFTRASTATYYGTQTAKAEENLLVQSQDFTTTWDMSNGVTSTANTAVAPDGTTTADTLAETATTSIHTAVQGAVSSGVVTVSVFAKANSGTPFLTIGVSKDASNYSSATFDLSAGTNTQTQATGTYSSASATVAAASQGFYRCTLTVTTDSLSSVRIGLNNTSTPTANNRGFGVTYLGVVTNSVFVWGAQLEQRSAVTAYTPTTTQTITNYIPVLQTAASGVARFEHNPVTGESLGLLIEESRTNLLTYSEQFDNAAWTKVQSSITANTIVAPDGALTGDKLVENTAAADHAFRGDGTISAGATISFSIYAKAAERTNIRLQFADTASTNQTLAFFNLSDGTTSGLSQTGSSTLGAASVTAVGNGWYRCVLTGRIDGSATTARCRVSLADASNNISYTGNGFAGAFIWGAQLEAGAFATSYIPTVASQVTRAADAASMTGTNFSSWYNQAEGTIYADVSYFGGLIGSAAGTNEIEIGDGTFANVLVIRTVRDATTPQADCVIRTSSVAQMDTGGVVPAVANTVYRRALAYATNNAVAYNNGSIDGFVDTSVIVPAVNQLRIGFTGASSGYYIRKIAYYPLRVSNTNLQALTS